MADPAPTLPEAVAATARDPDALHARIARLEELALATVEREAARDDLLHWCERIAGRPDAALAPGELGGFTLARERFGRACRRADTLRDEVRRLVTARAAGTEGGRGG